MKQLDIEKQRKQRSATVTQVSVKSTAVTQKYQEHEKHREDTRSLVDAAKNDSTAKTSDNTLLPKLPEQNEDHRERGMESEAMEIAETDNQNLCETNSSAREAIVNRTAASSSDTSATDGSPSVVNSRQFPQSPTTNIGPLQLLNSNATERQSFTEQSICYGSITNDPRFYVRASYENSQKTIILQNAQCKTNLESDTAANSIATSLSVSSQFSQYHDYCISEGEFDITLPSQLTPSQSRLSDITRITTRSKEIFQQIEGNAFDEEDLFSDTQMPLRLDLTDDEIVMS